MRIVFLSIGRTASSKLSHAPGFGHLTIRMNVTAVYISAQFKA